MDQLPRKQKYVILIAVMVPMIFVSLNQTIIGTTLPRIVEDVGGIEYFNWVFTIFMVTSSISSLLSGKMSDIFGRKPFLLIGVTIFTIASVLCGLADNMIQLIIYRGFHGFGGGIIITMALTTVGDLFVPRERGRWQALFSAQFVIASIFGPILGGYIVEYATWPWIFWFFSPFGFIALIMIIWFVPAVRMSQKQPIDYLGSVLFALTIVPLMLGLTWAGTKYEWFSVPIFGLLACSLIALALFLRTEHKAASPVLPLFLFKSSIFSISNSVNLLSGAVMFGVIIYVPFFIQSVLGGSALISGLVLIPMMMATFLASLLTGYLMTRFDRYKAYALFGLLLNIVGLYMASTWHVQTSLQEIMFALALVGIGTGSCKVIFTIIVQNAIAYSELGIASASVQLSRQVGGVIGVAVMGTVLNAHTSLAQGLSATFLVSVLFMSLAFVFTLFLKEIPLRTTM